MKVFNKEISTKNVIIAVLIGVILLLAKCSSDLKSKYKAEQIINQNNIEVLNDSIKTYRTKNGSLISERGVLIADKKELKELNTELYETVKEFEDKISKAKPQVVVKYITKVVHDTLYLESDVIALNDSTRKVEFRKDTTYSAGNSRSIAGEIMINLKADSTNKYNDVQVSGVMLTEDAMNIDATLVLGTKDGKLKVWLDTKYPGFEASQIDAVTLDPNIHPELRKLNNKKYSIGPYVGVGIGQNLTIQPSIGIGIQYSIFKF